MIDRKTLPTDAVRPLLRRKRNRVENKIRTGVDGASVKPAATRITRHYLFFISLGFLLTLSVGDSAWPYPLRLYQNCSGNCKSNERLAAFDHAGSPVRTSEMSAVQPTNLNSSSDVQAATPGNMLSHADSGPARAQTLKSPSPEGGSALEPRFFLLIGLALISLRLIIAYRSKKVKNLATGTH